MSLVVVGSVAIDSLITPAGRMDNAMGGSASYFLCAASYFSSVNPFVGVIGRDYPNEHIELLKSKSIDLRVQKFWMDSLFVGQGNTLMTLWRLKPWI